MNFAVIQARDFALQALRRTEPGLADCPWALIAGEGRKAAVVQVAAAAAGVDPGMTPTLAMARCPGVLLRTRSAPAEAEAQAALLAAAFGLSPRVESTAGGVCTVDLQGAEAAATRRGAEALVAAPAPAHADLLARWGVRTLGALTAIAKAELGRRLGAEGVALWERAAGETGRPIELAKLPEKFAADWSFAEPVETLEPLLFILRRFVERLGLELRGAGFAAAGLTLELWLDDEAAYRRELSLPEPSGETERLFRILHTHLEQVRTAAAVKGLRLTAIPARPLVKQPGLFDTGLKDPHGFAESLARVAALVGAENVGTPQAAATRRPDSFRLAVPEDLIPPAGALAVHPPRGLVLRRFRPAWPVAVELAGPRPRRIAGAQGQGRVLACRGPWRESGEWWRELHWAKETWQVELADGGLYQLARGADGWVVEGMWD